MSNRASNENTVSNLEGKNQVDSLNQSAINLARIDYHQSIKLANQALEGATCIQYEQGIAVALTTLGQCHTLIGAYKLAVEYLDQAALKYKKLGDISGKAEVLNHFGSIYSDMGELIKAKGYFEEALKLRTECNDHAGKVRSLNSIGDTLMKMGNHTEALRIFQQITEIPSEDQVYSGIVKYNIAEANFYLDNFQTARDYLDDCLEIGAQLEFDLMYVYCYLLLGKIERAVHDNIKSIEYLNKALNISREIKNDERTYHILAELAKSHEAEGNVATAYSYFKDYHKLKEEVNSKETSEKLKSIEHRVELEMARDETELERLKNLELQEAYNLIQEHKDRIEEQNNEITDSIRYAKRIQEAILPSQKLIDVLFPENFVFYKPKDELSGDFYWVSEATTKYEEKFAMVAVADCTGHGVPGALMSIIGNNFLRRCENEPSVNRPSEALDFTNEGVSRILRQEFNESRIRDGMDIAFVAIDYRAMKIHFAGAMNPIYLVRNGELMIFKGDRQPIGAYVGEELKKFSNQTIPFQKGDALYLFSDGYADQFGGPHGKKFMGKRFRELLRSNSSKYMKEVGEVVKTTFDEWKGDFSQIDDVCVFGLRL